MYARTVCCVTLCRIVVRYCTILVHRKMNQFAGFACTRVQDCRVFSRMNRLSELTPFLGGIRFPCILLDIYLMGSHLA